MRECDSYYHVSLRLRCRRRPCLFEQAWAKAKKIRIFKSCKSKARNNAQHAPKSASEKMFLRYDVKMLRQQWRVNWLNLEWVASILIRTILPRKRRFWLAKLAKKVQDAKGFSSLQIAMIIEIIGQATIHDWLTKVTLRSWEYFVWTADRSLQKLRVLWIAS